LLVLVAGFAGPETELVEFGELVWAGSAGDHHPAAIPLSF
jgi:hypothetical protein